MCILQNANVRLREATQPAQDCTFKVLTQETLLSALPSATQPPGSDSSCHDEGSGLLLDA